VPVLDSWTYSLYELYNPTSGHLWQLIRHDMLRPVNQSTLPRVRSLLERHVDPSLPSHACRLVQLTDVRLFDMLVRGTAVGAPVSAKKETARLRAPLRGVSW
jgi:hypothetical protein